MIDREVLDWTVGDAELEPAHSQGRRGKSAKLVQTEHDGRWTLMHGRVQCDAKGSKSQFQDLTGPPAINNPLSATPRPQAPFIRQVPTLELRSFLRQGATQMAECTFARTIGICKGFLLTADYFTPRPFVDGYFFSDADFIVAEEGAEQFRRENGPVRPGLDGCYVVGEQQAGGFELGTDFSGDYRLFLYRDDDYWAVSSSLMGLAEAVERSGRPLTLNGAQLQAWRLRGPFCNQLTSFRTIFNEIELVPSDKSLLVDDNRLTVVDRRAPPMDPGQSYEERLGTFLTVWLSRVKTLLRHEGFERSVDLSGGLDSRMIFALFAHLERVSDEAIFDSCRAQVKTDLEPRMRVDFETAQQVLTALGIKQAKDGPPSGVGGDTRDWKHRAVPAETAYDHWRTQCLGQYAPFRNLTSHRADFSFISFGGAGGEEYRPFYKAETVHEQAVRYARQFASASAFSEWHRAIENSTEYLVNRDGDRIDPLLLHYREFRSRFHSGSRAMDTLCVFPLKSAFLRHAAALAGHSRLRKRQLHFDVLHSLEPRLLGVTFDRP